MQKKQDYGKYGEYLTIQIEKELMLMTTSTSKMLIHFAHKDFKRCLIMDKHLQVVYTFMVDLGQETQEYSVCQGGCGECAFSC
jgi:hypothetical protein